MAGILLPCCSIFFSGLLLIIFYSKKRINLLENKIYSFMLLFSFFDSILTTTLQGFVPNGFNETELFLIPWLNKLDVILLIAYTGGLLFYTLTVSSSKFENNFKNKAFPFIIFYFISAVLIILLDVNIIQSGNNFSVDGSAINIAYITCGFNIVASIFFGLMNIKKKDKRYTPIYSIFFITIFLLIVFKVNPYLIVISITFTFVNYIMYHTIENPDLVVIEELGKAKEQAEKYVNEKEIFSFNMSQKIKDPITDIDEICNDLENTSDVDTLKEGIKAIKLSSSKIMYLVSDTLSGGSPAKIDVKEAEYSVNNLFILVSQYIKNKALKHNVQFYEGKYNKDVFVIGDNLKIKQVVCSFALNLIKLIENKSITLNTSTYNKNDNIIVSFKYIIPNINLTLEELNKSEDLEKYDDLDFDNISFNKLKKIINLLDGYIEIKSVEDQKLEIIINFEQKKSIIQNKDSLKYVNYYEKESKDKPSILIVDNKEEITKNINHFKYNVIETQNGEECLNMIRSGKIVNLIILDEDLDKLDATTIFNKLHAIDDFNIPVIYAGNISRKEKETELLDKGFADIILKPIKQKEMDEIINKYI